MRRGCGVSNSGAFRRLRCVLKLFASYECCTRLVCADQACHANTPPLFKRSPNFWQGRAKAVDHAFAK